jgi:hypothetical protein
MSWSSESSLPFLFEVLYNFSHACYMSHSSHPPWFDHLDNIWWSVRVMKLLIVEPSAASCLLGPNVLFSTLFSYTPDLYPSFIVADQVSNPFKQHIIL